MKSWIFIGVLVFVVGILLIIVSTLLQEGSFWHSLTNTIGGVFLGLSLGLMFSQFIQNQQNVPSWIKKGEKLDLLRKPYWHYHLTRNKKGELRWYLIREDYSSFLIKDYVQATARISYERKGKSITYDLIGLLFGDKLVRVAINHKSPGEAQPIEIIETATKEYKDHYIGVGSFEDWKGEDVIMPIIFASEPLNGYDTPGFITDKKTADMLKEIIRSSSFKFFLGYMHDV